MIARPISAPIDLDKLEAYLNSGRAPSDAMELSELDGFLAGLAAGPVPIPWSETLPVIWGGETPSFANKDESATVTGSIVARHDEIAAELDSTPDDYAPIFWEDMAGTVVADDWAIGFMQAVSMRPKAWAEALRDEEGATLLIPIALLAGSADPGLRLDGLPEGIVEQVLTNAPHVMPACVRGLHAFWRQSSDHGEPH